VFGSGLGHATRVLDMARRLRAEGTSYRISSFGQGLRYMVSSGEGANVLSCPSLDVEWAAGGFSSWHVLPRFPIMLNSFMKQLAFEGASIPNFDPDVVVSDSRLSPVFAGKMKSYPVITILNQFTVAFPPRFRTPLGRFYERVAGDSLGLMWSLSDQVLMTDLPPPYTIGETNMVGPEVASVLKFVGFTSPSAEVSEASLQRARAMLGLDGRPLVFCQVSGPDETKEQFRQTILRAAAEISKGYNLVVSMGYPEGSPEPRRLSSGAWLFDWCPIKDELFRLADLIVARAGHSTIGQCIDQGKPAVLVPIYNHPEQIGNAEKFRSLGLGVDIRSEKLTPEGLSRSVEACLSDSKYKLKIDGVSRVSRRYNGIQTISETIRSFSSRRHG
jgi:UDP-N-acetylglucosamine--N-acetylmuramyl-(pentapeptide) pyrophosphoryl-undecaprenol N-acetylglucosamine transferase